MLVNNIQYSYLKSGTWNTFSGTSETTMDGIKIKTPGSSPYFLRYRTWNSGKSDWYSRVDSNVDDYAGAPNRPIQRLQIQVYDTNGVKITEKIVVMYRARVAGRWLPWVSNAEPEWMQSVHAKYNLGGTIDTNSFYAGNAGQNMDGLEIRVYEEGILGDFTGGEVGASALQYMVGSLDNWQSFDNSFYAEQIDGIKIQTASNKGYYLQYRTKNEGKSDWYPFVKSTGTAYNDYAGYPGKAVQLLEIQAYKNDGTRLRSGVIVMYRVSVEGRWLPWVSNADAEWMRDMQNKHSLGGTLSVNSTYAGNAGQKIDGVEIRIFEDDTENAGTGNFTGFEEGVSAAYMHDSLSNWEPFEQSVTAAKIDGISLGTDADEPYYFMYKSWNEGNDHFYPEVNSLYSGDSNYAGYPGKPMQLLSISVYSQDGTKLRSGVVVMYRVRVAGRWLPWVSNADAEWMQSVQKQYGLDGTLDTKSTYAGNKGQNIDGVEIRVFQGKTDYQPVGPLPGAESSATLQYMADSLSNWTSFSGSVLNDHIDGIKIQTDASKPYYLSYRSWNAGKGQYYPYVDSRGTAYNDYAGYPGKPIQLLNIYAYANDGTKLKSGVVVMYRVHVDNRWLPWVSNANPEWMVSVQEKYDLGGTLDTRSTYAGNKGQNINGVEIHIFEENGTGGGTITPVGKYKIIPNVPFISQVFKYPTGCESVSTVMALNYAGVNISVDTFIDDYLDKKLSGVPFDPDFEFGGNPRSTSGYGCYAPVIKTALDKVLVNDTHYAKAMRGMSIEYLCKNYIDKDIPVIFWATQGMETPRKGRKWVYNLKQIQWISPMHCLLLVGYDDTHYIFNDPQKHALTYYSKDSVQRAYDGLFQQAVVILNDSGTVPYPIHQNGAVENPMTKEIYPIMVFENGKNYPLFNYQEEINSVELKPTQLQKSHFDIAKFIAGLTLDNNMMGKLGLPGIESAYGIVVGGITSLEDCWERIYIDIKYYKDAATGKKYSVVRCGENRFIQLFQNWEYGVPVSLKSLHPDSSDTRRSIDDFAKKAYGEFKGITPNDSYHYNIYMTYNEKRKHDKYISQLFLDDSGKMYEYATIYENEKLEIVVKKGGGIDGILGEEIDRIDILPLLNPVTELPTEKMQLFQRHINVT